MNTKFNFNHIADNLEKVRTITVGSYITLNEELIIDRLTNIYFRLEDIECSMQFDCKMIEWLSRPSHKGLPKKNQAYIRNILNKYFDKNWTIEDLSLIYTKLGNEVNRELTLKFIDSDFDLNVLEITKGN